MSGGPQSMILSENAHKGVSKGPQAIFGCLDHARSSDHKVIVRTLT